MGRPKYISQISLPVLACLLARTTAQLLSAQTYSASIVGRVGDSSGAILPRAALKVTNFDTNQSRQLESNATSDYAVPDLQPGCGWDFNRM
jgi:hypothetical protein